MNKDGYMKVIIRATEATERPTEKETKGIEERKEER